MMVYILWKFFNKCIGINSYKYLGFLKIICIWMYDSYIVLCFVYFKIVYGILIFYMLIFVLDLLIYNVLIC